MYYFPDIVRLQSSDFYSGLFKGVGKGVVGVFAQPATSVIDFASHQLQAFNYAIDPSQAAKPLRVARFFNNKEIKPYNRHKARGLNRIVRNKSWHSN